MLERIAGSDIFHNVCNAIQDAVCILDRNLTVIQANLTMEKWFRKEKPLVGQKCYMAVKGQSGPCPDCPCDKALKLESPQAGIFKKHDAKGRSRWYEVHAFPLFDKDGSLIAVVNHIRDATLRIEAERQQLEATAKIAKAEKLSSLVALTAGITHELSQPLNAIKVLTDSILFWFKRGRIPEPEEIKAKLQDVSNQVDRADQIIKHVRSLIRHEQPSELITLCNLNEVVNKAANLVASQLRAHGITVKKDLSAQLPPIKGDEIRLQEAVINLLVNAMQSLDEIESADKKIGLKTRFYEGNIVLEISDNGVGLADEVVDNLFEPFITTKLSRGGMGLGLSYVYSIVRAHGAHIAGRNNDNGGATFQLRFQPLTDLKGGKVR